MKNIIIGTAGHIDHGKTTLIKALTGRNTDRWEEEQRRGITIDLGFTYFDLPGGDRAGIIDVPGHEKFINNMVAGVVGMDLVLLVIAADEGIMPQTREHMDILNLLGIEKSIIVLNKCDLVDEEWLEMMEEDVREELSGTFLEHAPLVKVSAATGAGLDDLVKEIEHQTRDEVVQKDIHTIPRLPIVSPSTLNRRPRVFSPTGTLIPAPVAVTSIPFCRPSLEASMIQRAMLLPTCWATSMTQRFPPLSTSRASLINGSSSLLLNSTSTTGPMTCTILPFVILLLPTFFFIISWLLFVLYTVPPFANFVSYFRFCALAPPMISVNSCVMSA